MQKGDTFFYSYLEQAIADGYRFDKDAPTIGFLGGNWQDRTEVPDVAGFFNPWGKEPGNGFVHIATYADGAVTWKQDAAHLGENALVYLGFNSAV